MGPRAAGGGRALQAALSLLACLTAYAGPAGDPRLAIIIDDLGHGEAQGRRVAALPGPVACAVLPDAAHAAAVAAACHEAGKAVLLHLPMAADGNAPAQERAALDEGMTRDALRAGFEAQLARVPFATGVNNHQGSRLTRHLAYMEWLMETLRDESLFFVDSRTTAASVALRVARANGVPAAARDVFLDNERDVGAITRQLRLAAARARERGAAIAIGHPYPETLVVLERELGGLAASGIIVVSPGELAGASWTEDQQWHAYSFRSPRDSRSSRR